LILEITADRTFKKIDAGPIGAGGPEKLINRSFPTISELADALAGFRRTKGLYPVGLDPHFPGLQQVFREGDPDADIHRQPVDFFSPDTFNYATMGISGDGRLLSVDVYGIHAYAPDTFPTLAQVEQVRRIQGFQVKVR
jgi:alkaline phosphatase D